MREGSLLGSATYWLHFEGITSLISSLFAVSSNTFSSFPHSTMIAISAGFHPQQPYEPSECPAFTFSSQHLPAPSQPPRLLHHPLLLTSAFAPTEPNTYSCITLRRSCTSNAFKATFAARVEAAHVDGTPRAHTRGRLHESRRDGIR